MATVETFCENPQNLGLVTYCCSNMLDPSFLNPDMKEKSIAAY